MKRVAALLFCTLAALGQETTEEKPITITGVAYIDYYAVASHHDESLEGKNGFWMRRGYLTFDKAISDELSARLRFEVNSPGDFETNTTLDPFVKDAWLRYKRSPRLELIVGISPSPAWETVERVWGYRSVERTPLDLHRLTSARDFGIGAMGQLGRVRYHVLAGNGSGTGAETNEEKRVGASVLIPLTASILVELFGEREARPGEDDRSIAQLFAAIDRDRYRAGVLYAHQSREPFDVDVLSLFGVMEVWNDVSVLARVDRMFDPSPEGDRIAYLPFDTNSESTLFIIGADWKMHRNVSVIPNAEIIRYDSGATTDILPRLTVAFTF